jgi:hypothetical protein
MAYNTKRRARMATLSESALRRIVDAGTLSSAAASYALRQRGIVYVTDMGRM